MVELNESELRIQLARSITEALLNAHGGSLNEVILFGSTSRREAQKQSDIDLCLVFSEDFPGRIGMSLVWEVLNDWRMPEGTQVNPDYGGPQFEFELLRESEMIQGIDELGRDITGLVRNIRREGVVLYPPQDS